MTYSLYYHPKSGHAYKVGLFFALSSIPVSMCFVDIDKPLEMRSTDFQKYTKFGEVPTLVHKNKVLAQSNNILLYLAEQTGRLGPFADVSWTDIRMWLFWEANRLGLALPNLRFAYHYDPTMPKGAFEWLHMRLDRDLNRFEKELADGRMFILGKEITIADLSLAGYIFWADEAKIELEKWPRVFAWRERLKEQSGWLAPKDLMPYPMMAS